MSFIFSLVEILALELLHGKVSYAVYNSCDHVLYISAFERHHCLSRAHLGLKCQYIDQDTNLKRYSVI